MMNFRSALIFRTCSATLAFVPLCGMHAQPADGLVRDGAFLEAGGQAIYWSLNYERTRYYASHWATHGRVGLCVFGNESFDMFLALPVTFSASYGGSSRAEFGLGLVPFVYVDRYAGGSSSSGDVMLPTIHAGYRYQHYDGNWFLRAGAMVAHFHEEVMIDGEKRTDTWGWNPYLSIGVLFEKAPSARSVP